MQWTDIERQALENLFSIPHPCAQRLRAQLDNARVSDRTWTGVGFFTTLDGTPQALRLAGPRRVSLQLAAGELRGVPGAVTVDLFLQDGLADVLEGHISRFDWDSVQGPDWPPELEGGVRLTVDQDAEALLCRRLGEALDAFSCTGAEGEA